MIVEWALVFVFPALMIFAGACDLFTMTIPNRVSLALVAGFVCLAPFAGFSWEMFGYHVALGAGMLAISILMFARNWIGGGDAKLIAAASLWMGPAHILEYGFIAALSGGLLTLIILRFRNIPLPAGIATQTWVLRLHRASGGVPYGIALSTAGLMVYPDTPWLKAVV
ncbi:MAG: prepilin peptidase [Hyphomicrobiaceae bacterium]|nr:prepilin peptidase [Hyphomicrobiaceae bacterium]